MGRHRAIRAGLGLLLSAWGITQLVSSLRLSRIQESLAIAMAHPELLWPLSSLLPDSVLRASMYACVAFFTLCNVALAVGGLSVVFGHKLGMKLVVVGLGAMIGLDVLFPLPTAVGVAASWITVDWNDLAPVFGLEPRTVQEMPTRFFRLVSISVLFMALASVLIKVVVLLWLRRDILGRPRSDGHLDSMDG